MSFPAYDAEAAAAVLTSARLAPEQRPLSLPEFLRPADIQQAYAVQDLVVEARGAVAGWKVGASSPTATPVRAALTRDSVHVGEHIALNAAAFNVLGVEAELVYEIVADLPPRLQPYGEDEVLAAVGTVRVGIEVCDTRYAQWGQQDDLSRIADQANHGCLTIGTGRSDFRNVDPLAQPVSISIDGRVAVQHAAGGNSAGHPFRLLVWLANEGARSLGGLRAGQWVTTGSCTGTEMVQSGAVVVAVFPGVGRAQIAVG
ncbi:MAG: 2-keto-4-pentenoate hydratase [Comamonas sp.]